MNYTQLVNPKLTTVGTITRCLEYARKMFGAPAVERTAWLAWKNAQYRHTDALPTGVAYPLWFSYWGTIDGVYDNYGHVVVYVPGEGYYSSPWQQGTTHAVLSSVAEVEATYYAKYVGWTEDISTIRVVEPQKDTMIESNEDVDQLYLTAFHRYPESDEVRKNWFGLTWPDALGRARVMPEYLDQNHIIKVSYPDLLKAKGINRDSVLEYTNKNLK